MMICDGNIENKCHQCGESWQTAGFDIQHIYLWANQHGKSIRFFCHRCGAVFDVTDTKAGLRIEEHTMRAAIWSKGGHHG